MHALTRSRGERERERVALKCVAQLHSSFPHEYSMPLNHLHLPISYHCVSFHSQSNRLSAYALFQINFSTTERTELMNFKRGMVTFQMVICLKVDATYKQKGLQYQPQSSATSIPFTHSILWQQVETFWVSFEWMFQRIWPFIFPIDTDNNDCLPKYEP